MRPRRLVVAYVEAEQRSLLAVRCCPDSLDGNQGDLVTIYNGRNCEYRTETDYTPHWETRTVRIS